MVTKPAIKPVVMEDVKIIFRNFAGAEGQFNAKGDRNFSVVLPKAVAEAMISEGWNVRSRPAREEGEDPQYILTVKVNFDGAPPARVYMISSKGQTQLDEDTVGALDYAELTNVDLIVNPYAWAVGENHGIKAYLKTLFATVKEDELELKYSSLGVDAQTPPQ